MRQVGLAGFIPKFSGSATVPIASTRRPAGAESHPVASRETRDMAGEVSRRWRLLRVSSRNSQFSDL